MHAKRSLSDSYLNSQGFHVGRSIGSLGKVGQVELHLVPALVQPHGHGADERLHAGVALEVRCAEAALDALVVEDLKHALNQFVVSDGAGQGQGNSETERNWD